MKKDFVRQPIVFSLIIWLSQLFVCSPCSSYRYGTICKYTISAIYKYSPANNCLELNKAYCELYKYEDVYSSYSECIKCEDPCNNKGCSYTCKAESGIAVCSCPIGMKLQADGKQCAIDLCYNKGCSHICTEESGNAVCSCPVGMKLQQGSGKCVYDVCYNKDCYRTCPVSPDSCSCSTTMTFQPDAVNCFYAIQKVTASFDVFSSQISKDALKQTLASHFNNFCTQRSCYYIDSEKRINRVYKPINLSVYISAFYVMDNKLTLSFFIINSVKDVLNKETVEAGLNQGITFQVETDGAQNSAKNDVKTTNASLTITLTCCFSGLFIFVAALIFFMRWRKKRAQSIAEQSAVETQRSCTGEFFGNFGSQRMENNVENFNDAPPLYAPPPPYAPEVSYAVQQDFFSSEAPPGYFS